jgi:propionyl-CoA carboxylase alpha chain
VEFVVDEARNFYFLEMNTRLQVEHPVTELITGIDLVEWMLRIAAGEPLALTQDDVGISGWSIESRVYAEDPFRGFVPSTGRLLRFRPPAESATVRVDTGVSEGGEVSMHYDPMVAKLVTYGPDRKSATAAMCRALDRFQVKGIQSNIPFLATLVMHPRFVAGDLTTSFIEEEYPEGFAADGPPDLIVCRIAALVAVIHKHWRTREQFGSDNQRSTSVCHVRIDDAQYAVEVCRDGLSWSVNVNHERVKLELPESIFASVVDFIADGIACSAQVHRQGLIYEVFHSGTLVQAMVLESYSAELYELMPRKIILDLSHLVLSPMPGLLVSLSVETGDMVKAGEELAVIEAMKMENVIRASRDGTVAAVHVCDGEVLEVDQAILEFEQRA